MLCVSVCVRVCTVLFCDGENVCIAVSIHYLHRLSFGDIGIVCLDGGSSMCLCVHVCVYVCVQRERGFGLTL